VSLACWWVFDIDSFYSLLDDWCHYSFVEFLVVSMTKTVVAESMNVVFIHLRLDSFEKGSKMISAGGVIYLHYYSFGAIQ